MKHLKMKVYIMNKVEKVVTKGEIARFEQISTFVKTFSKIVCCRAGKMRLYVGVDLIDNGTSVFNSKEKVSYLIP